MKFKMDQFEGDGGVRKGGEGSPVFHDLIIPDGFTQQP